MKKILVNGYLGKMGQSVLDAIKNSDSHQTVFCVDLNSRVTPNTFIDFNSFDKREIDKIDCIVDFTNSKGFIESAEFAMSNNIPFVSGSTGYSNDQLEKIKNMQSQNKVGVALCSNFSTGALLLAHLGKIASKYYNYAELIESHHEKKLDAPSGTAISIANTVSQEKNEVFKKVNSDINKIKNTRGNDEAGINIHSLRLPGVIAKHELIFGAPGENLSLIHNSSDRKSFMPGVLLAINYVIQNDNFVDGLEKILGL